MEQSPFGLLQIADQVSGGNFSEKIQAIIMYTNALEQDHALETRVKRGKLYYDLGIHYAAIDDLEGMEDDIEVACQLARSYKAIASGKFSENLEALQEAARSYERALEKPGQPASLYYELARVYDRLHEYDRALDNTKKAILLDPKNMNYRNRAGLLCMLLQDFDSSLRYFEEIEELEGESIHNLNNMGAVLNEMGRYRDALDKLRAALEFGQDISQNIYFHMGNSFLGLEDRGEAFESYIDSLAQMCSTKFEERVRTNYRLACETEDAIRNLGANWISVFRKEAENRGFTLID